MKQYRGFVNIVLFYIIFTILCGLLGGRIAGYENVILFIWYFTTLAVWFITAVIWISLIVKIKRFDSLKDKFIRKRS